MLKLCKRVLIWWPNNCENLDCISQLEIGQASNLLKHPRIQSLRRCLLSKSVKQILWSPRHNTKDTSQDSRRHHACLALNITWCQLAYHNQGWKYFAVRRDQVAIQPVTAIPNLLLIHIRSEILPPVTGTPLNKDFMSSDQEVAQSKPNPVLKT